MSNDYVQERGSGLYVGKSRVSLDSVLYAWREGLTPDAIQKDFPSLRLADIYGAIAYYLDHQEEVDQYLRDTEELWRTQRAASEAAHPEFYAKMRERFAEARNRLGMETPDSAPNADSSADSPTGSPTA